jgi:hypothetical protein
MKKLKKFLHMHYIRKDGKTVGIGCETDRWPSNNHPGDLVVSVPA